MERKIKIIQLLHESDAWIKGNELASLLGVSARTIRNDMKILKEEFSNEVILTSNTKGYKLNKAHLEDIKDSKIKYYTSQNERLILILKQLVLEETGVDIDILSQGLYISEHTLEMDIYKLNKYIKSLNLENTKLMRKGSVITLKADYKDRNNLLYDVAKVFYKNIRLTDFQKAFEKLNLLDLYALVREVIIENKLDSRYISLKRLTVDIALLIEKEIIIEKTLITSIKSDDISCQIATSIIERFKINLDEKKQEYISHRFFMILTLQEIEQKYRNNNNNDQFAIDIRTTLEKVGSSIDVDFLKNEELVQKLITHLRITVERKKIGFKAPNPLIDSLKNECQFVFSLAILIVDELKLSLTINDISYIVVYLLIIINENKQWYNLEYIKVAILVSDGFANLEYIANQIKLLDESRECTISKFSNIDDIKDKNVYDIIVSTNNLVSNYKNGMTIDKGFGKLDRLKIKSNIYNTINNKKTLSFRENISSLLHEQLFEINNSITKKEEAIKILSDKLLKLDYVDNDFYEAILKRERLISSRIESQIAIPHSFNYNSKKSGISILISPNGIDWGMRKVKVVILISLNINNRGEFIKLSNEFNKILLNNKAYEDLLKCKDVYEVGDVIEKFLTS
ncbi:MAG: BglG family transcription antiterminator [Romboutsia sp.]|uniref:BglG family transcription antiterminator n=1 Tax=Romboutsia sp. TaxID=1965302 RepID=UPI003F30F3AD